MNYILYNPKANNENNDLTIIHGAEQLEQLGVSKIDLIGLDVPEFCKGLSSSDRVFICGGDGTLHHFANNSYGVNFPCPIFALRSGTGNDFLNDIGQKDNENLIDIRQYIRDLPCVEVNGMKRYFINGAGLGVDGAVCEGVEKFKARTNKKKANYTVIALKQLAFEFKRPCATVTVDGVFYGYEKVWSVATMKGRFFGGGMMIAPGQDRSNGKISVMAMHGGSKVKTIAVFTKIFKGEHIKYTEMVNIFEGNDILVEFSEPCAMQIDGEVVTNVLSYRVTCNSQSVEKAIEEEKITV